LSILLLPQFNVVVGKHLSLSLDMNFVLTLVAVVFLTGIVAGSYPAFYLSKFSPAVVLKGTLTNLSGKVWARQGLVVFQFTLSVILIVSVWVVYQQIHLIQTKSLGYDKDNVIMLAAEGKVAQTKDAFINEVLQLPGIVNASFSGHDMKGHNGGTYGVEWEGKNPEDRTEFENIPAYYRLIETLEMEMKEGRTFSKDFPDSSNSIIFNETAVAHMGITDPIGKTVKLWGKDMRIIGVTKDFHFESLHDPVKPAFFWLFPYGNKLMVRIKAGEEQEVLSRLQRFCQEFNPGFPFEYRFMDDNYQSLYAAEQRISTLSKYFAALAVLISCLGLFGLATFTAERRMKEIGIRKVLGASVTGITILLSKNFLVLVLIAVAIATPVAYYFSSQWLEQFAYQIELKWWVFAASGLVSLIVALITVSFQAIRAAHANPVRNLRAE
jgi:putative ABC transport system permease protein